MSVTRPNGGDGIATAWGQGVSDFVNLGGIILSSDVTGFTGSFSDLTGLSFTCTSGKNYNIQIALLYNHDNTGGGPLVGFNHPGGSCWLFLDYNGKTSATSSDLDTATATDSGTGITAVNSGAGVYWITGRALYQCTANGTFTLRAKRNTTGTLTIKKGSAIRVISD